MTFKIVGYVKYRRQNTLMSEINLSKHINRLIINNASIFDTFFNNQFNHTKTSPLYIKWPIRKVVQCICKIEMQSDADRSQCSCIHDILLVFVISLVSCSTVHRLGNVYCPHQYLYSFPIWNQRKEKWHCIIKQKQQWNWTVYITWCYRQFTKWL